jgi:pyrroline-5-carboxylate reductase
VSIPLKGTLVLIGAGKMGGAMLEGWLKAGVPSNQIVALDPSPPAEIKALLEKYSIAHNPPIDRIEPPEVLLVAVKPQIMDEVLKPLAGLGASNPLILSIAAGKTIASFERHFGGSAAIIRTIPNTPAAVGQGITAMAANKNVTSQQMALAESLLLSIGEVVRVDNESLIDAATAVSGSGPAYIFYMTECLTAAAESVGLPHEVAVKLARATVAGSGSLMQQSGIDAATLRQNVTSPKGTTYEALQVLMADNGMKPLMIEAIKAATRRSKELAS